MVKLAIKGHKTRGKEVIEILEMLGGNNYFKLPGKFDDFYYYIWKDDCIHHAALPIKGLIIFTLEEFLEKYPYKVGDKVNIPQYESEVIIDSMKWDGTDIKYRVYCGCDEEWYIVEELKYYNEIKQENMEKKKTPKTYEEVNKYLLENPVKNAMNLLEIEKCLKNDGMKLPENLRIHSKGIGCIEFIKWYENSQYPKTYKECCDVLLIPPYYNLRYITYEPGYNEYATSNILISLQGKLNTLGKLLICRDAYWKIAGNEMGLEKSWEPNWNDEKQDKYGFYDLVKYSIINPTQFVFPTEEMRDKFYEKFNELIEDCKEML